MLKKLPFLAFLIALQPWSAFAQVFDCTEQRHATTFDWTFQSRLQILDPSHSFGGDSYDRGFNRIFTPEITKEYDFDMFTFQPDFDDSFDWYECGQGSRSITGSYIKSKIAVFTHIQKDIIFSPTTSATVNAVLQQDGRADRAFFEFKFNYNLNQNHQLYFAHTLSEEKKDLDVTTGYKFQKDRFGDLEISMTVQDHFNNLVNVAGNSTAKRIRDIYEHEIKSFPVFLFMRYRSDTDLKWHLDISSGYQPVKKLERISNNDPDYSIFENEEIIFFNGSFSYNIEPFLFGSYFYYDRSHLKKTGNSGTPFDGFYYTEQKFTKKGFFAYAFFSRFTPHLIISLEDYLDHQDGTDFTISSVSEKLEHTEDRVVLNVGSKVHFFDSKFKVKFQYLSFLRNQNIESSRILTQALDLEGFIYPAQKRATVTLQMTPTDKFFFELGFGLDIDKDNKQNPQIPDRVFDKGYYKIMFNF